MLNLAYCRSSCSRYYGGATCSCHDYPHNHLCGTPSGDGYATFDNTKDKIVTMFGHQYDCYQYYRRVSLAVAAASLAAAATTLALATATPALATAAAAALAAAAHPTTIDAPSASALAIP